jgi:hypothetical protein
MNGGPTSKGKSMQGAALGDALGFSEKLPQGEQLLWQGQPERHALAARAMYLKYIAFYLVALIAARTGYLILDGESVATWSGMLAWQVLASAFVMLLIVGLAVVYSRTTRYSLTNERLIIKTGAAITIHINLPLQQITAADLREYSDGTGDITLQVSRAEKLYWLLLWPNTRSWWIRPLRPVLRGLKDVQTVAHLLVEKVGEHGNIELGDFNRKYPGVDDSTMPRQQATG